MARGRRGTGVDALATAIRCRFTLPSGERVVETLELEPTTANLKRTTKMMLDVRRDIAAGALDDQRYLAYFPDTKRVRSVDVGDGTLRHYSALYLRTIADKAKNTQSSYGTAVRFWLKHLGEETKVTSILHSKVKAFWGSHPWKSWKQANNYLIALRGVLALARRDGVLKTDPLDGIENKTRPPGDEPDPLSEVEEQAVLGLMAERYPEQVLNYFDFSFATGMRPEEVIELRWGDIDQNAWIARVQRARSLGEVRGPKNGKARDVELNSVARAAITRQAKHTRLADGYVFLNPKTGEAWNSTASQRDHYWNPTLKALGIRHRTAYTTRHTRASRMLARAMKPGYCADQLGHSLEMFFRVYAKWINGADNSAERSKDESGIRSGIGHGEGVSPEKSKQNKGLDGRRDWTRTTLKGVKGGSSGSDPEENAA